MLGPGLEIPRKGRGLRVLIGYVQESEFVSELGLIELEHKRVEHISDLFIEKLAGRFIKAL
jgi:hypothetical protein